MFRCVCLIAILQAAMTGPCPAAEGWLCTHILTSGKQFQSDYVVVGDSLMMNKGGAYATILMNNDDEIIAYIPFWVDGYRHKRNGATVIADPKVSEPGLAYDYFIINKKNNTLINLEPGVQFLIAGVFLPDTYPRSRSSPSSTPDVEKSHCTRMDQ